MDIINLSKRIKVNFKGIVFDVESISKAFMSEQYILKLTLRTRIDSSQNIEDRIKIGIDGVIGKKILFVRGNVEYDNCKIMLLVKVYIKLDFRVVESILLHCFSIDRSRSVFKDHLLFNLSPEIQKKYIEECGGEEIIDHELFIQEE